MLPCVTRNDPTYDQSRIISNARFDYRPSSICYCESEEDVKKLVPTVAPTKLRVRSGGHHHEGMCSGDGVTIVDVSKLSTIWINNDVMVVGPGARLRDVYQALWNNHRLLPGGGCGDVCVGGLVQGGGWGPYSRSLGLTCDRLRRFRMVKADGTAIEVANAPNDPNANLFWAVAGGGGGNFGVVTQFEFELGRLDTPIISFTINWYERELTGAVINDWMSHFPGDGNLNLTSFARLTAFSGGASLDAPVIVAGNYRGEQADLDGILSSLLPNTWAKKFEVVYDRVDKVTSGEASRLFHHPAYQPGPPAADEKKSNITSTCDGFPFPHKVSSCFPGQFGPAAVQTIVEYLLEKKHSPLEPTARRYLSLHSFGGAIANANDASCFAYRDKPFMLQYQAWWANKEQTDVGERCINWVRGFRDAMHPYTEGAFINFPDREVPLASYYGGSFKRLIGVKRTYDPDGRFDFEMGIPRL